VQCVCIRAIGGVLDGDLCAIADGLAKLFKVEVKRLPPLPDPEYAFDPRRKQYGSVEVMRAFAAEAPGGDSKVIGITERDLFIPMLTFVFGQAQLGGRLALVSLARLRQEFYGLPPDPGVFTGRALKEVAHELGHTLGLSHCADKLCAMSLSTDIRQVDGKRAAYCQACAVMSGSRNGKEREL
jgi:archaemetzincin